jgi:hypothetical protein
VVVGVDEALQQLEPAGRLGPAAGLDLLADAPLVALLDQTSIIRMLVRVTKGSPRNRAIDPVSW